MNRKTIFALGALAASLALAACSTGAAPADGPETADPAAEAPESNPGPSDAGEAAPGPSDGGADALPVYSIGEDWIAWTMGGAELAFEIDVPVTDPRVADAEEIRTASAAEPVSYSIVSVDNRLGLNLVNMYSTKMFTEEGETFELVSAGDFADEEWGAQTEWLDGGDDYRNVDAQGTELSDEDYSALVEMMEETDLDAQVDPGAVAEVILVGPAELPEEITRLTVSAEGMVNGEVQAVPAAYAEGSEEG